MHAAALLACLALASLALGALGLARVGKQRRGLKSFERTCLLDPLSLPSRHPRAHDDARATRSEVAKAVAETAARLAQLISPLRAGVEQAAARVAIPRFLRPHALARTALRFSGLSLLMANQQIPTAARALDADAATTARSTGGAEAAADSKRAAPQPTWSSDGEDDGASSDVEQYTDDSDASEGDASDDEFENDSAAADENDAQRALFDGLQFYTVLTQVGVTAVRCAMEQAVLNAADGVARQRAQASISAIEQHYPDILCLSAPGYAQRTPRADLASALLAVSAASSSILNSQQQLLCSSMQRRLSLKRPDTLALAPGDAHEPMARTPLTSPGAQPQLETSFLQAA